MRMFAPLCAATALAIGLSACATSDPYYDTAQGRCERERQSDAIAGAAAGAAIGALAGSAIAGNSSNTEGTIIGGVAGAAIGSQIAKNSNRPCPPGYAYYPPYRY